MTNKDVISPPINQIDRIHAFARDLAVGIEDGQWGAHFRITYTLNGTVHWNVEPWGSPGITNPLNVLITSKWNNLVPSPLTLCAFGYFERIENDEFIITEKALALLRRPASQPTVFISYRRADSSAFALLIEARLRLAGNPNPFVDKNIPGGEDWHGMLKDRIQSAQYFIILVGQTTLESDWVRREITWAVEAGCKIIALCHSGMSLNQCPHELTSKQGFEVKAESALEYEAAANFVLNGLGYATY